ncbi:SRPBCC family protein [Cupriavidus taiwanensis]|uniref:Cyclase involved in lipopeptide siderophore synthesis ''taiwachelin n=1 Tax=Cupriavidus taiwanensis TaxID=164546 RepID=A0A375CAG3_9BURK|nr:SRPBCC family protein [Cupriavidus taiwanensis]MDK3025016.1 SRPBCC family protein [Cupriavidus taiwanensis]NSX13686.1 SRPBCC family protein [Cupriavidus taiwanensis]SOY66740.1 cyclase; involved in lipopeptide siderophore synthesis ''taiwachelin'' [Cupriavidus taiwanensis]
MSTIEESIDVRVPVQVAYQQWSRFEEFPRFMDGVEEVRQLDDRRLHWRAEVGGKQKEWDAEITQNVPDQCIAWRSVAGAENSGQVNFTALDAGATRVSVRMNYETEGVVEAVGDAAGVLKRKVEGDLKRFKDFIEARA